MTQYDIVMTRGPVNATKLLLWLFCCNSSIHVHKGLTLKKCNYTLYSAQHHTQNSNAFYVILESKIACMSISQLLIIYTTPDIDDATIGIPPLYTGQKSQYPPYNHRASHLQKWPVSRS